MHSSGASAEADGMRRRPTSGSILNLPVFELCDSGTHCVQHSDATV